MEDTEQRAHRDALVHEAGFLQVRGQAHSHQLQHVGVPQLAAEAERQDETTVLSSLLGSLNTLQTNSIYTQCFAKKVGWGRGRVFC